MSFGLCNAPMTFKIHENYVEMVILVYLDDIIVLGNTFYKNLKKLDVFKRLQADLSAKLQKVSVISK